MSEPNTSKLIAMSLDKFTKGVNTFEPISSSNQLVDICTKALPPSKFKLFLFKLNLTNLYGSAYGGVSKDSKVLLDKPSA